MFASRDLLFAYIIVLRFLNSLIFLFIRGGEDAPIEKSFRTDRAIAFPS